MKPSLQKLQKIFKLEAERGYDNHAVVGGLERMLDMWSPEARNEGVSEEIIQYIEMRFHDYGRLSEKSRSETLLGIWKRIQRGEMGIGDETDLEKTDETKQIVQPATVSDHPVSETQIESKAPPLPVEPERVSETVKSPPTATSKPGPIPQPSTIVKRRQEKKTAFDLAALNAPIIVLQGIGPRIAENLNRLGLNTLRDMLYFFPRRYDDYSKLKPINRLVYGEDVTVIGVVKSVELRKVRGGQLQLVEAQISDGSAVLRVTWFNQVWMAKRLHTGLQIVVAGKVDQYLGRPVMTNPEMEPLDEQQLNTNRIVPVYPLTAQVTQRWLRKQINQVVDYWAPRIPDPLSEDIIPVDLIDLSEALKQIHFPDDWESLHAARNRISFDEVFYIQLGVLKQKRIWQDRSARKFEVDPDWLEEQIQRLPYQMTNAQNKALADIQKDLNSGHPMNRLIQGDVGSGKTVVAGLSAVAVIAHSAQACIMAPTSILAEQHYQTLLRTLAEHSTDVDNNQAKAPPPLRKEEIRLLIGATPEAEKEQIRQGLADGSIKLAVGTHALIEDPVTFYDLQLIVVDEQHRFGVEQRATLRSKGENPHMIVMTATPIPRSLALTIYGDLDLTLIDEMPPGRQPVDTYVLTPKERERAYALISSQVEKGQQAFIVYPLIEESETSDTPAAVVEYKRLQTEIFPMYQLGLVHGRMRPDEKEAAMNAFRTGKHQILVSTTVIEVGVDIPNATVMLIEGANRFGLAQLHQLRGRVGRGGEQSFCLLIPETANDVENERLQVMVSTNDGFVLAEKDLEQRGPGQFLGTQQAGFPKMQMANLIDTHMIEKARRCAQNLFEIDPELTQPEHQLLASSLQQFWEKSRSDIS